MSGVRRLAKNRWLAENPVRGSRWFATAAIVGAALSCTMGCATIPEPRVLSDAQKLAASPSVQQARKLAPASVAKADALAREARRVMDEGGTGAAGRAQHLGEQAMAAYETARAVARAVAAKSMLAEAESANGPLLAEVGELDAELARQTADVLALERELAVLEELEHPAPSGTAGAEREAARRAATRSLLLDAQLFCVSATLLGAPEARMTALQADIEGIEERLAKADGLSPIDGATRARAGCLTVLTELRRATAATATARPVRQDQSGDALLAALSAAKLQPSRDDRGVFVTQLDAFEGDGLSKRGQADLSKLLQVAEANPEFPVLLVVHDASTKPADVARGQARTRAAEAALVALPAERKRAAKWAGTSAPLVDPKGASASRQNTRLEVVFVMPSMP